MRARNAQPLCMLYKMERVLLQNWLYDNLIDVRNDKEKCGEEQVEYNNNHKICYVCLCV